MNRLESQDLKGDSATIPSMYWAALRVYRSRTLFNVFDGSWLKISYGEFDAMVSCISALLIEHGLAPGDRVAVVSENRPEWCAAYLAVVQQGVVVPIDAQLGQGDLRALLDDSGARIVLYGARTGETVRSAIEGSEVRAFAFESLGTRPEIRGGGTQGNVQSHEPAEQQHSGQMGAPCSPDDVAAIIYTSGTTGVPKGVMLTHRNLCSDARAVMQANIVSGSDNVLAVLPLHHTYPCMCTFLVPLFIGGTVTFAPGLKASDIVSAIRDNAVTVVVAVPRLLDAISQGILSKIREKKAISMMLLPLLRLSGKFRRRYDLNLGRFLFGAVHRNFVTLRFFASGGAKLDPTVMENLEALGFTVLEGYGLTETSPVVTFNPLKKRKPGSAGMPLPDAEIQIHGDGEVKVRGPMVMKGYYKHPDATAKAIVDGWFFTGDTGYLDEDNYLFITGRKKEVIVLSTGKNIYPEDVEKAYSAIPLIKEICVTGQERRGGVESLHALIVPDLDYVRKESIAHVNDALRWSLGEVSAGLPEYMRIRGYTLLRESLPRTPLGKIRRFMVRDLLAGLTAAPETRGKTERSLLEDNIGGGVVESIQVLTGEQVPVNASDDLEVDLGFDSLKKIEFFASLERKFSVDVPEALVVEVRTVADVVSKLKELLGGREAAAVLRETLPTDWTEILRKEPSRDDLRMVRPGYGKFERLVIRLLFGLHKAVFTVLFRIRVRGAENLLRSGPFIIAPNHASYLDGFIVASSVSFETFEHLFFLGLQRFFTGPVRSWFARLSHVIPIDLETNLARALQLSSFCLLRGRALCIFPEGGRSFEGTVLDFRKGVGVLAVELNVPVVPAYLSGTAAALPRGASFIRLVKVGVTFGPPLYPAMVVTGHLKEAPDVHQMFSDELRRKVIELSEEVSEN
ncbi:MAG: AMP-binding protein [Chloroflexota bacterium]